MTQLLAVNRLLLSAKQLSRETLESGAWPLSCLGLGDYLRLGLDHLFTLEEGLLCAGEGATLVAGLLVDAARAAISLHCVKSLQTIRVCCETFSAHTTGGEVLLATS